MPASSLLRRGASLALMLCLGLFWSVEVAAADVHDGDGVTTSTIAAGVNCASSSQSPYADVAATCERSGAESSSGSTVPAHHDAQSPHVDHCAHAHAAPGGVRASTPESVPAQLHVLASREQAPTSRGTAPPVPPPVD